MELLIHAHPHVPRPLLFHLFHVCAVPLDAVVHQHVPTPADLLVSIEHHLSDILPARFHLTFPGILLI